MTRQKGIYRIKRVRGRSAAWGAIIKRVSGNTSAVFTDSVYGGSQNAYRAAIAWYNAMEPRYPIATRVQRMESVRNNNKSGVTGVYRWPASGEERVGAYWAAQWVEARYEKPKRKKFSIACYGERKARRLAIEARNVALDQLRALEV